MRRTLLILCLSLLNVSAEGGAALQTLYSFPGSNGGQPQNVIQGSDGNLYGVTAGGGAYGWGTVFKISGGTLTVLYSFTNGVDGNRPTAGLVEGPDGNFYSTMALGGAYRQGMVYRVTPGGQFTVAWSFDETNGSGSEAALAVASNGLFYGTTTWGGAESNGTIFSLTTNGEFTVLASFDGTNGLFVRTPLAPAKDGTLYGASLGGTAQEGNIFKLTPGGLLTNVYSFTNETMPTSFIMGSDGNLYGTSEEDTDPVSGAFFEVTTNGLFTTLHAFSGTGADGASPNGIIEAGNGVFYGTTEGIFSQTQVSGYGTVFSFTPGGAFSNLVVFNGTNGLAPTSLALGQDGSLYGTTAFGIATNGGVYGNGTVFQLSTNGALTEMAQFNGAVSPMPALFLGAGRPLYGATAHGGSDSLGTIFAMATNGALTNLVTFPAANEQPNQIVRGPDGLIYGTTASGGAFSNGSIFRINGDGSLTNLYSFTGSNDGGGPTTLVLAPSGDFYGLTSSGGSNRLGAFFQLTTNGEMTTLASFAGTNGSAPNSLVPSGLSGWDGAYYGTAGDGPQYYGEVFRVSTNGSISVVASFDEANGSQPSGLIAGGDGNFYGTVASFASESFPVEPPWVTIIYNPFFPSPSVIYNYNGGIFKLTPAGELSVLFQFDGTNGANPHLVTSLNGVLYGYTPSGGIGSDSLSEYFPIFGGDGTIFSLTLNGAFSTVAEFDGTNGANPASMVFGGEATFYGTTARGGAEGAGTLFVLSFGPAPSAFVSPRSQLVPPGGTATISAFAPGIHVPLTYQWLANGVALTDDGRITGSTSNVLTIRQIGTEDAGSYQAIVSNEYGAATNTALVAVAIPPVFKGFVQEGTALQFSWLAVPNQTYQIQYTTNLGGPWSNYGGPVMANGPIENVEDAATNEARFYRVVLAP